jgi:hypothetical protein
MEIIECCSHGSTRKCQGFGVDRSNSVSELAQNISGDHVAMNGVAARKGTLLTSTSYEPTLGFFLQKEGTKNRRCSHDIYCDAGVSKHGDPPSTQIQIGINLFLPFYLKIHRHYHPSDDPFVFCLVVVVVPC